MGCCVTAVSTAVQEDIGKIDKSKTPWVFAVWHTPWCAAPIKYGLHTAWMTMFTSDCG